MVIIKNFWKLYSLMIIEINMNFLHNNLTTMDIIKILKIIIINKMVQVKNNIKIKTKILKIMNHINKLNKGIILKGH